MKMKRFLIAALALALLIAFAPSLPLHTASAATVVTGVTITGIDAPVAGAKPDYTASGSGAGYYVEDDYTSGTEWRNGVEWYDETAKKYDQENLKYGCNEVDGEEIYFIPNPALGLWINREKFEG